MHDTILDCVTTFTFLTGPDFTSIVHNAYWPTITHFTSHNATTQTQQKLTIYYVFNRLDVFLPPDSTTRDAGGGHVTGLSQAIQIRRAGYKHADTLQRDILLMSSKTHNTNVLPTHNQLIVIEDNDELIAMIVYIRPEKAQITQHTSL